MAGAGGGGGSSNVPPRPPSRLEGALARKHRASNLARSPQGSHPPAYQRRRVFSCVRSQKTLTLPVPLPVSRGNDEGKEARRAGFPDSGPGRPQVREGGLGGRDQGDVSKPGKGRRAEAGLGPWRVPPPQPGTLTDSSDDLGGAEEKPSLRLRTD